MIFIYDKLAATMIATAVLLMILSMQMRLNDANIEQTALYSVKRQSLDLGDWLQKDIGNAGSGVPINESYIEDYVVDAETENTQRFSFRGKINAADASPTQITYELAAADTLEVGGETEILYQLYRCVDSATCSAASTALTGSSPPSITFFRIDLLDESGSAWTAGTSSAYYLRIRFSMSSPWSTDDAHMRIAHWGTVLPVQQQE
jgi:hypothetical protein